MFDTEALGIDATVLPDKSLCSAGLIPPSRVAICADFSTLHLDFQPPFLLWFSFAQVGSYLTVAANIKIWFCPGMSSVFSPQTG